MSDHREKSTTDIHWNERAKTLADSSRINIDDLVQRGLETDFILSHLKPEDKVLEIGCGNGHLTQDLRKHAKFVDAFDFSENMIQSAKDVAGEENNRFFVHSVLSGEPIDGPYDSAVCVRVLINLNDVEEQIAAVKNMAGWLKPGGKLILVEGYSDGFEGLNDLRGKCGLGDLNPAAINFYAHIAELMPTIEENFETVDSWHSGMFDILTRVVYPLLVGSENASGPAEFHEKIQPLAKAYNPDQFKQYARLYGHALIKK